MAERYLHIPVPAKIYDEVSKYAEKGNVVGQFILRGTVAPILAELYKEGVISEFDTPIQTVIVEDFNTDPDSNRRKITLVTLFRDGITENIVAREESDYEVEVDYDNNS